MTDRRTERVPPVLILATQACAYPGADHAGQIHAEYPTNAYVVRVPAPVLFPEEFYLRCFRRGIGGILVASCGHECPYEGAYDALAARIGRVHALMKQRGIDTNRLRLCAICTVCSRAFLKEVRQMCELAADLEREMAAGDELTRATADEQPSPG